MRKLIFTSLAIMLYTAGSFAQDVHYPLKSDVKDISGSGLDGTVVNTVTYENDPIRGEVAVLGADNGYITLPPIFEGYEAEATVAIWFRNDFAGGTSWSKLFSFGTGNFKNGVRDGAKGGFWITPISEWGTDQGNFATCHQDGKGWNEDGTIPVPYVAGEWHHYAMTISVEKGVVYVDGEFAYEFTLGDDFDLTQIVEEENLIGTGYWNDPSIVGAVSDMQIHFAALTQAEIKELMGPALGSEEIAIAKASIKMYPNPAKSMVTISAEKFNSVEIFNTLGQSVLKLDGGKDLEVNTSNFNKGVYLVKFSNDELSVAKRLLVN